MKYQTHINIGDKVKDTLTGFKGIASGAAFYMTGCAQILVQPTGKKAAGKAAKWFDDARLKVLEEGAFTLKTRPNQKPGGPTPSDPSRKTY